MDMTKYKTLASSIFIITIIASIISLKLTHNAVADNKEPRALPVHTVTVKIDSGYYARRSFTGRAVTGRKSNIAFELNGTLKTVEVDTGSTIKKGDLIATLDTDRLEANKRRLIAEKSETASNLDLAERTLVRVKKTFQQGHASAQSMDEAEASAISLQARLQRLEASIAAQDVDLAKAHVRAPFSGVITNRLLDEGTVVTAGTPIIELAEIERMEAHIGFPPDYAKAIINGSSIELRNGKRKIIENVSVRSMVPVIEGQTRTMMVTFDLPSGSVSEGELINAVVKDWQESTGAWLPLRALSSDVRGMWRVYKVVTQTNPAHVEFENVQILYSEANKAFVTGTISEGDIIIADGLERLAPGQLVTLSSHNKNN